MPTHQDETLQQRYEREHQDYLKLCGSMTAEQVADLNLQLNNALAREQSLQQRLTEADERADVPKRDTVLGEPAYWADDYGNTIKAEHKSHNEKLGGAPAMVVERYTTPLYAEQPLSLVVALPNRDTLRDIIAQAIGGDTYDCTRVWSAWSVGTMSDNDFMPVVDQEARLYEITDACLEEFTSLNAQQPLPPLKVSGYNKQS